MTSVSEERSFENALNQFIDDNVDDKFLVDVEDPVCRLTSPRSGNDSPTSEKSSRTLSMLNNIRVALKDGSEFGKTVGQEFGLKAASSKSFLDRNSPNNKKEVLEHAEAVIEYQRERINILEKTLQKYNIAITKTAELHKDELDKYEKQNKDMRLQMQNVISDYDAISKRYQVDMEDFESLKGKNLKSDSEILKKDKQIKELERKLELLPKENELLKAQKSDLQQEVKALKKQLFPPIRSWQSELDRAPTEHVMAYPNEASKHSEARLNERYKQAEMNRPHVLCDVRKQETAAMGRCLMQVENDLTTYKRLCEDQRSEIQRLNNLLNSRTNIQKYEGSMYFGSHNQLMNLREVFVSMVKASNQISENIKVKEEEPEKEEDRSLHAAYVLKSNSEQREMYDKLLEVVRNVISVKSSSTSFYRCKTDYCKLVELNEFDLSVKFHKMLVEADDSKLLVHQLEDDQIVHTEMVLQENLKGVRTDYKNLQIILKDEYYHVFRFETSDAYNRFYYALQYAGFVVDDGKLSIYSKVDLTYLNSEENWPQDLVPVLFSKVVTMNTHQLSNPYNVGMPNAGYGVPGYLNMGLPSNMSSPFNNMDAQVNNLFENVNVMSEFTTSLLYYDQNSRLLVVYGPNLANKPKVLNPANTYKFKILNNLEYSNVTPFQAEGGEEYVDSYQVPFATFPNGEPVMEYFNPQLTNYSLVSFKNMNEMSQLKTNFGQMSLTVPPPPPQMANKVASPSFTGPAAPATPNDPRAGVPSPSIYNPQKAMETPHNYNAQMGMMSPSNYSNPMSAASPYNYSNQMNMGYSEFEFDVYYVLPLSPRYNSQLTKLMDKLDFLRLKSSKAELAEDQYADLNESDRFYKFVGGNLEVTFTGIGVVAFPCSSTSYTANPSTLMITIVPNADNKEGQTSYSFKVSTSELYKEFVEEAERNGMTQMAIKEAQSQEKTCVVTKGMINIFEKGPNGEPIPYLSYKAEETDVKINSKKRSLHIVPRTGGEYVLNMDCLEEKKYEKWLMALKVGGFLGKSEDEEELGQGAEMAEFKFEIKSYNEQDIHENRSVRITSEKIVVFAKPSDQKPIFVWQKSEVNVEILEHPKIRISLKKNTKFEEVYDLLFPVPYLYEDSVSMLHKYNYKLGPQPAKRGMKYGYIISEPSVIRLFKAKSEREPTLVLHVAHYQEPKTNPTEMIIKLLPKVENKGPIKLAFRKRDNFNKFVMALRVANFLPFVRGLTPKLYRPEIIYRFACPEVKDLLKNQRY